MKTETFLPVTAEDTKDHRMHAEWGEVTQEAADAIDAARKSGGRVVAVGTTALRVLESAAGADGVLIEVHHDPDHALSDGAQTLNPTQFQDLMGQLRLIAAAVGRSI